MACPQGSSPASRRKHGVGAVGNDAPNGCYGLGLGVWGGGSEAWEEEGKAVMKWGIVLLLTGKVNCWQMKPSHS